MKTASIKFDVLKSTVRGAKKKKPEFIVIERVFCPICGSDRIRKMVNKRYRCSLCKTVFLRPKKARIKIRKNPRYIG